MEPLSRTEQKWGEVLRPAPGDGCLEADQLLLLSQLGRKAPGADAHYAHLAACPNCRRAFKELREIETLEAAFPKRAFALPRFLPWAAGLAAAAVLVFFAIQFLNRPSRPEQPLAKETAPRRSNASPNLTAPPAEFRKPNLVPGRGNHIVTEPRELRWTQPVRRRLRKPPPTTVAPQSAVDRPVETMDAHVGWSRDEISGEVLSANATSGEVVPPNIVQGEVAVKRGG